MITEENKEIEVFGTKEFSVKEFMGSSDKSFVLLSDYDLAKENLEALNEKHKEKVTELVAIVELSPSELKELNNCRAELREPRYLIQNIEENNISVFEAYKKIHKTNLKQLIDINRELEDKASEKIKSEKEHKKQKKEAEAKAEENRINTIKERIEHFETNSYQIIQSTTFDDVELNKTMLDALVNSDFDYEEYDILFEQAKGRVQASWNLKCNDIQLREEQRLENEKLKQAIFDVRVSRLKEVDYEFDGSFFVSKEQKKSIGKQDIFECSSSDFEQALSNIKAEKEAVEQAKRDAELKKQKDEQFEVRKNRLAEIELALNDEEMFCITDFIITSKELVYNATVTEFEEILTNAKKAVSDTKEQKELADAENLYQERVKLLLQLGLTYDSTKEYPIFLEGNSKLIANREVLVGRNKEWFDEFVSDVKTSIAITEKELQKKADAENKARVKRLASDKKFYENELKQKLSRFPIVYESKEIEIKNFSIECSNKVTDLLNDLLTQLNEL